MTVIPIEQHVQANGTTRLCCGNCGNPAFRYSRTGSVCSQCGFPIQDPLPASLLEASR